MGCVLIDLFMGGCGGVAHVRINEPQRVIWSEVQASADGIWAGRYRYDERNPETRAIGRCHVDATLRIDSFAH